MAVICSLLFVGCSSEEPILVNKEGIPLKIQTSITPYTKASLGATLDYEKSSFVNEDQIKIYQTSNTGTTYNYKYDSAKDLWLPVSSDIIKVTGNTEFTATYPADFASIQADQSQAVNENPYANYLKSNQLKATSTSDANSINFKFKPANAKITLVITYDDDTHTGGIAQLTGSNLISSSSTQAITLLPLTTSGKTHTYVGIVYPGENKEYQIVVKESVIKESVENSTESEESEHNHKVTNQTLKAGYNYTYNFSSNNNLILNQVTITAFDKKDETEVNDAT